MVLSGTAALADPDAVSAATPAATGSPSPRAERGAVLALQRAYHAIADAQALGSSTYLDAAKAHYRGAIARYARHDAGAAGEAMAASALAFAAVVEHPAPGPRDIPSPPPMTAPVGAPPERTAMGGGMRGGRPGGPPPDGGPPGPGPMGRPGGMRPGGGPPGRFDPTRLAAEARVVGTAEAKDLAQKALDADVARSRAAFAGNLEEAARQGMLAEALAGAVGALARADHPPTAMGRGDRAGWQHRGAPGTGPGPGVVGDADLENG